VAERWNGTTWAMQSIPTPTNGGKLGGVSCTSASACTTVGYQYNSNMTALTLAEGWNGTTWAVQATPNPGSSSGLEGVSCTSASACTAAGSYFNNAGTGKTLAERYGPS
jgi:hypothetical protein